MRLGYEPLCRITDENALPLAFRKIDVRIAGLLWETALAILPDELGKKLESIVEESRLDTDSIKTAIQREKKRSRRSVAAGMAPANQVAVTQSTRI